MLEDVVSVARPASSDGGSAPIDIRSTPALLVWPSLPVAATEVPTTITASRPTSPAHIIERFRILLLPPSEGACDVPSKRLLGLRCRARRREGPILTDIRGRLRRLLRRRTHSRLSSSDAYLPSFAVRFIGGKAPSAQPAARAPGCSRRSPALRRRGSAGRSA